MKKIFFAGLFLSASNLFAQLGYFRYDSIEVIMNNDTLMENVWAGAFNSAQWSHIDLNGDDLQDLVFFERDGFVIKTFLNKGTINEVSYYFAPEYIPKFPKFDSWMLLRDYNCDGHMDIFARTNGGIQVWRNTFVDNSELGFELVTSLLKSEYGQNYVNLYVASTDIPAIDDIDNDGDLDILTFGVTGTLVEYHRNQSMDSLGTCDSLYFRLDDPCWGKFYESAQNNSVIYPNFCKGGYGGLPNPLHAGSSLLTLDTDEDGDKELVLGDISFTNMLIVINGGDSNFAQVTAHDSVFPKNFDNDVEMDMNIFPAGYYFDVNNDNVKDLLVSPNANGASENYISAWYYKNEGQDDNPDFKLQKQNFMQDEMIELGAGCNPTFFDVNADGLLDIVAGNYGYYDQGGVYPSGLAYFKNVGNTSEPKFEFIDNDYANVMALTTNGVYPAFGDLDGDGDDDMIVGDFDGFIHFYINSAGAGNPANFNSPIQQYSNIDVGQFATPQIIDVDKDGVLDLVIGERGGTLNFFKNAGTVNSPAFPATPTNSNFGGIDVMDQCCTGYSNAFITELDTTGDYYMFVGSEHGTLYLYENIDGNIAGNFDAADSLDTYGHRISVAAADINDDGKLEVIYGEYGGGMAILTTNKIGPPIGISETNNDEFSIKLFPNPANDFVSIGFSKVLFGTVEIEVTDVVGRPVENITKNGLGRSGVRMNTEDLNVGTYLVKVTAGDWSVSSTFVKQ